MQVARDEVDRNGQCLLATCRLCTSHVHRGGKRWTACVRGGFRVCPTCAKESVGMAIMTAHLTECSRHMRQYDLCVHDIVSFYLVVFCLSLLL